VKAGRVVVMVAVKAERAAAKVGKVGVKTPVEMKVAEAVGVVGAAEVVEAAGAAGVAESEGPAEALKPE